MWWCMVPDQGVAGVCEREREDCERVRAGLHDRVPDLPACVTAATAVCFAIGAVEHCTPTAQACETLRGVAGRSAAGDVGTCAAASERVERGSRPAGDKDPATAAALSYGSFFGGVALLGVAAKTSSVPLAWAGAIGAVFGPTIGHGYADDTFNGWLGLRVLSIAVGIGGSYVECSVSRCAGDSVVTVSLLLGVSGYVIGTLGETITAPQAARDYNRAHHLDVQLAPVAVTHGAGLALAGRF